MEAGVHIRVKKIKKINEALSYNLYPPPPPPPQLYIFMYVHLYTIQHKHLGLVRLFFLWKILKEVSYAHQGYNLCVEKYCKNSNIVKFLK